MKNPRSARYRRLAMQEPDQAKAQLLYQLAEEADRGILFTVDWKSLQPDRSPQALAPPPIQSSK